MHESLRHGVSCYVSALQRGSNSQIWLRQPQLGAVAVCVVRSVRVGWKCSPLVLLFNIRAKALHGSQIQCCNKLGRIGEHQNIQEELFCCARALRKKQERGEINSGECMYVRPIGELSSLLGGEKLFPLFLIESLAFGW